MLIPRPMQAKGEDFILDMWNRVFGFPARVQGMFLNAVINTIDKVQTDQALREAEAEDRRRALLQTTQEHGEENTES